MAYSQILETKEGLQEALETVSSMARDAADRAVLNANIRRKSERSCVLLVHSHLVLGREERTHFMEGTMWHHLPKTNEYAGLSIGSYS